jgi:hypothetical protein
VKRHKKPVNNAKAAKKYTWCFQDATKHENRFVEMLGIVVVVEGPDKESSQYKSSDERILAIRGKRTKV